MAPLDRHCDVLSFFSNSRTNQGAGCQWMPTPSTPDEEIRQTKGSNKKVSFCDKIQVRTIQDKKSLPSDLKSEMWYCKKDYNKFKSSCKRIIEFEASRGPSFRLEAEMSEKFYCSRGLERFTSEGTLQYMERISAILNDMYWMRTSRAGPTEIAEILKLHTAPSVAEARARARVDAHAAKMYQAETSRKVEKTTPSTSASTLSDIKANILARQPRSHRRLSLREFQLSRIFF